MRRRIVRYLDTLAATWICDVLEYAMWRRGQS